MWDPTKLSPTYTDHYESEPMTIPPYTVTLILDCEHLDGNRLIPTDRIDDLRVVMPPAHAHLASQITLTRPTPDTATAQMSSPFVHCTRCMATECDHDTLTPIQESARIPAPILRVGTLKRITAAVANRYRRQTESYLQAARETLRQHIRDTAEGLTQKIDAGISVVDAVTAQNRCTESAHIVSSRSLSVSGSTIDPDELYIHAHVPDATGQHVEGLNMTTRFFYVPLERRGS